MFCRTITETKSTLDFEVSARGWCYILENKGIITKGDFDAAAQLIVKCRKNGRLPLDIVAADEARSTIGLQSVDNDEETFAEELIYRIDYWLSSYTPFAFGDGLDTYV